MHLCAIGHELQCSPQHALRLLVAPFLAVEIRQVDIARGEPGRQLQGSRVRVAGKFELAASGVQDAEVQVRGRPVRVRELRLLVLGERSAQRRTVPRHKALQLGIGQESRSLYPNGQERIAQQRRCEAQASPRLDALCRFEGGHPNQAIGVPRSAGHGVGGPQPGRIPQKPQRGGTCDAWLSHVGRQLGEGALRVG